VLNWAVRYAPAVDILKGLEVNSILDVGSGEHGIRRFFNGPRIIQTDLDVDRPIAGCDFICADALHLPFGDGSLDAVLSLDLLEHLAPKNRTPALHEMFRVARDCVIVGFPVAPGASIADDRLAAQLSRRHRPIPPWLLEHRGNGYPTQDLGCATPVGWTLVNRLDNDPLWLHISVARLEHQRLLGRVCSLPMPLRVARAISKTRGAEYYRSISVFRRADVEASRA
jgi:SAM-dependent methyltransferase